MVAVGSAVHSEIEMDECEVVLVSMEGGGVLIPHCSPKPVIAEGGRGGAA